MNICDRCDRGQHRICTGCDCVLCPIFARSAPKLVRIAVEKKVRVPAVRKSRAGKNRVYFGGSRLPEPMQKAILIALGDGIDKETIAKRSGCTRDQVRYLAKSLQS